ncbi:hypothetical protein HYT84_03725, partial [Candidatus Micrarchaeota archaeon]|nr:hypothetical protein [Candidatus Micrarchaeota archaeon]
MKKVKIFFAVLLLSYVLAAAFGPEDAENAWDESFGPNSDYFYESNLPTGQGVDQFTTSIGQSFGLFFQDLKCDDKPFIQPQKDFISGAGAYVLFLTDLYFPTIFAAFIVIMAITLVYLGGKFFESDQLVSIAKEEYWQTTLTSVRVVFILASIIGGNLWFNVSKSQTDPVYSDSSTIIDAAMAYSKLITYKITNDLGAILVLNTFVHTLFSATVYIGITIKAMFSFQVGPILKPIVDILGVVIQFLSVAMGEWVLHFITLCFIKKWTFSILVPIAFILRAFPQTRGGGDALLALLFS